MQLIWIHQWTALPVVVEDPNMSEKYPAGSRLQLNPPADESLAQPNLGEKEGYSGISSTRGGTVSYEQHHQAAMQMQQMQQLHQGPPFGGPGTYSSTAVAGQSPPGGTFTMSSLLGALPELQSKDAHPVQTEPHRLQSFSPNMPFGYVPQQQTSPYTGLSPANVSNYGTYSQQYPPPLQPGVTAAQGYGQSPLSHQFHSGGPSANQSVFTGQQYFPSQQAPTYLYYPGQSGPQGGQQQNSMQPPQGPYHSSYIRPSGYSYGQLGLSHHDANARTLTGRFPSHGILGQGSAAPYGYQSGGSFLRPGNAPAVRKGSAGSARATIPSAPRGPPRKPKQSGYAFWVGNLPAGAHITDLKDHFSREATKTIESVFLISKSNCAFVNYRSEEACVAAMARFHDSRFHGVRLVCRLRRSSTSPAPGVPTGPAALMPAVVQSQTAFEAIAQNREISSRAEKLAQAESSRDGGSTPRAVDKYFVMKSLTVEDMELSLRNHIWATQAHNEEALNKAFETTDNVYLIFSANKSGEYFGVARMASPINEEAAASLDWTPPAGAVANDPGLPRSIPTPATEFAPKGRIIDDSARGTIFWEADPEDEDLAPLIDGEVAQDEGTKVTEEVVEEADDISPFPVNQSYGKPFKIEWVSTNRLPFYRTRGLRNPWNAHREVKIARDGTELETSVGRRLVQMFQKSDATPGAMMPSVRGR